VSVIEASDANVISLVPKIRDKCYHQKFSVDHTLDHVTCDQCGERLNPMWVLKHLTQTESRAKWKLYELQEKIVKEKEKIEAARNKIRCKCRHCGKMTPIIKFNQ